MCSPTFLLIWVCRVSRTTLKRHLTILCRLCGLHIETERHLWPKEHARRFLGNFRGLLPRLCKRQRHESTVRLSTGLLAQLMLTSRSVICRAFQGIGASGLYSLTQIGLVEVGPSHRPSIIGAMIGATLAFAFILGPLIGGAVAHLATWRWLFNMKCDLTLNPA